MADYWVSQTRKYCDFCKCWITDNKPSVEFHEKGRRHQENVKKRLRTITKQSTQTQKAADNFDATIKHMESAAMNAYRRDMETNPDMTSTAMVKKLRDGNLELTGSCSQASPGITKLWNETKTKDGKSFYLNIMTNERVWKPPKEGFLSVNEQRERADTEAEIQLKALETYKRKEALATMQERQKREMEESSRLAREKLKERRVVDDTPEVTYAPLIEPGRTNPYGRWETVREEEPVVDYQLPILPEPYEIPVEFEPEPYVKEFKEKTIDSLGGSSSGATFKKRKFGGGAKRNTRQRVEDD